MPVDLSGRFVIVAEVKTKYGEVRLVLNASNRQERELLRTCYTVSGITLRLKGISFTVPRRKISKIGEMEGNIRLGDEACSTDQVEIFLPSVYLGYDLSASLRFQDISIKDQDSYSGSFSFSFSLRGPGPLPSFGDRGAAGSFQATRSS